MENKALAEGKQSTAKARSEGRGGSSGAVTECRVKETAKEGTKKNERKLWRRL